jgi:hypothetical protein
MNGRNSEASLLATDAQACSNKPLEFNQFMKKRAFWNYSRNTLAINSFKYTFYSSNVSEKLVLTPLIVLAVMIYIR